MSAGDTKSKRHLRLMSEVLPRPDRASATGPRARTLAHMQRLLTVAAAAGALGAACTKEATSDTIQTGDPSKDRTAVDPSAAGTTTSQIPSTVATAPEETPGGPTGYAVVDPLPSPGVCAPAANSVNGNATWRARSGGGMAIELRLPKPGRRDVAYARTSQMAAYQAKIASTSITGGALLVTLIPEKDARFVALQVPIDCSAGAAHLAVNLELTTAPGHQPSPGDSITLTVSDTF
jgi:hypothetical protein